MARPKIEKVESSVKGGVVAQPGAKTLILGRNGRGKSAIVNAIELAGSGKASDVAGRALLALDADLFMLAPPGAEKVWASARLSDGAGLAEWSLEKGHRAKRKGPEIAFPLRDVRAALLGASETARKWILQVGGSFDRGEVLGLVPASLHKRLDALWTGGPGLGEGGSDAASDLVAALEGARKRVRECNATVKAARSLPAPSLPPPTDQDITAIEAVIQAWGTIEGEGESPADALALIAQACNTAKERAWKLCQEATAIENELAVLPSMAASLELRNAAVVVAEYLARAGASECAICGGPAKTDDLRARAARGRAKIDEAIKVEDRRRTLISTHANLISTLALARREVQRLETEQARAEARVRKAGAAAERPTMTLADARSKLSMLHTARAGWAANRTSEERALAAERDSAEWDQLADALSKALGQLVEKARVAFTAKVQRFLPREFLFGIDLLDGDREVLRVGLLKLSGDRMVLHAALSGAEWATVTAALALATAPAEGPCVVCPEERAFDPETLSDVLAAFDQAVAADPNAPQIVITSPTAPTKVPLEWTVIVVGDDQKEVRAEAKAIVEALDPKKATKESARKVPRKNGPAAEKPAEPNPAAEFKVDPLHLFD